MKIRTVAIDLDSKCDTFCEHCCFTSSPTSTVKMEKDYIRDLVIEFAKKQVHPGYFFYRWINLFRL